MKLAGFLGCLLAVAPLGIAAQTGSQSYGVAGMEGMPSAAVGTIVTTGPNGQTTTHTFTVPNLCPVRIQASHLSDGSMIKTAKAHPKGIGQRLHLTLTSPDSRTIASAIINVRGWTAKGRAQQVSAGRNAALLVRTLTIAFTAGTGRNASADAWAPGLTSVTSVELVSVAFADGTTWTPANGKTCRVTPDPLMLITER